MQHKRPKDNKDWLPEKERELLSYDGAGYTADEVALLMGEERSRVVDKAGRMGVSLARRKKC